MNLQELKKMIAEEYAAYKESIKEQPDLPGISVSSDDVDTTGGDAEATLKDIYDMLKDYFEGDKKDDDADADSDTEDADDEKDDVEEGMYDEDEKDVKKEAKSAGSNAGFKAVNENKTSKKLISEIKNKQFRSRFQKLANIK